MFKRKTGNYLVLAIIVFLLFAWGHWKLALLILYLIVVYLSWVFSDTKQKEEEFQNYSKERKLAHPKLYIREVKRKARYSPEDKEETTNDKEEEIMLFFRDLEGKDEEIVMECQPGITLNDTNYDLFCSLIGSVTESLSILCWRVDEKLLSKMLWLIKDKDIEIRIIAKNQVNIGYLNEFKKRYSSLKIDLVHRSKIHAKVIIKDKKIIAVGSSNITESSMSKASRSLDCNLITDHQETVEMAVDLFESIYDKKDYMKKIKGSKLMYSRNNQECLPVSLKAYFERETEEIVLLFSCDMVDKRIIDRIIEWNSKTPINLYVGDSFKTSGLSTDNLNSMRWMYDASITDYRNIKVIPTRNDVHAKLILFKNQQTVFVSSQNLTVSSWQSLLEAGVISEERNGFQDLYDSIKSLERSGLSKIESGNLEETNKPESPFSGTNSERTLQLPWDLAEVNSALKIVKQRGQRYFNLVQSESREKQDEPKEAYGGKNEGNKIIKNPLVEKLEEQYLQKHAITGLYSKPTRGILTGKQSETKRRQEIEWKLKELEEKLEIEPSENKRREIKEGIKWCKDELDNFDR